MANKKKLEPTYQEQVSHNERMISELLQKVRPEIWVLMDLIDRTGLNPVVIFKFIRQLNNIVLGSRWGQVTIVINNGVAKYIKGEDTDKIEENVVLRRRK